MAEKKAYLQRTPESASRQKSGSRAEFTTMKATSLALDHLLRAVGDPVADLRDIGPGHPEFNQAQIIRAAAGVLAKIPDTFPAIAQAIRIADGPGVSPQIRAHLAAAEAWLSGNPVLAAERYASILSKWPRDLLALRLAQSCFFFLGWHDQLCAVVDAVVPAWRRDQRGFRIRACHGVVRARRERRRRHTPRHWGGKRSRTTLPARWVCTRWRTRSPSPGDTATARNGCATRAPTGPRESRMCTHNAWHLAMFDTEEGNVASALGILDAWLLPASVGSPLDACDATGLLWRLATEGVDDEGRWCKVSDAFERTMTPGFWPYVDLHAALAHLSAGKQARAQRLVHAIERYAQGSHYGALRARRITQPGLRALGAWAEGRYGEAAELLASLRPVLGGGRRKPRAAGSLQEHRARGRPSATRAAGRPAPTICSKRERKRQGGGSRALRPTARGRRSEWRVGRRRKAVNHPKGDPSADGRLITPRRHRAYARAGISPGDAVPRFRPCLEPWLSA